MATNILFLFIGAAMVLFAFNAMLIVFEWVRTNAGVASDTCTPIDILAWIGCIFSASFIGGNLVLRFYKHAGIVFSGEPLLAEQLLKLLLILTKRRNDDTFREKLWTTPEDVTCEGGSQVRSSAHNGALEKQQSLELPLDLFPESIEVASARNDPVIKGGEVSSRPLEFYWVYPIHLSMQTPPNSSFRSPLVRDSLRHPDRCCQNQRQKCLPVARAG